MVKNPYDVVSGAPALPIYTDAPKEITQALLESEETVDDLPSPDRLVKRYPKTKVTITLNTRSVNFFKQYAQKNRKRQKRPPPKNQRVMFQGSSCPQSSPGAKVGTFSKTVFR
ncbi:hypothetical protein FACS1894109_15380 [Spirochaetia bacterium]|nr:hypothetical protein FACS1894109_15380 [Spirochaetia bacterium]